MGYHQIETKVCEGDIQLFVIDEGAGFLGARFGAFSLYCIASFSSSSFLLLFKSRFTFFMFNFSRDGLVGVRILWVRLGWGTWEFVLSFFLFLLLLRVFLAAFS